MTDARWLDVESDLDIAVKHLNGALRLAEIGSFKDESLASYRDRMAFMHAMECAHTSMEAALKRILRLLGEEVPDGNDWHRALIVRLSRPAEGVNARPALLDAEMEGALQETRSFRHRVMHAYDYFDMKRAEPALAAARLLEQRLQSAVQTFKRKLEGLE